MSLKNRLEELAIFGGRPAFGEKLHVGRPNIGNREILLARINNALDERWLTNNGPYVQEFESRLAEITGAKHCIAMCNATIALEIAIRALGLTGEVILPSMTFIATAHALQWQQITRVCDKFMSGLQKRKRTHSVSWNCGGGSCCGSCWSWEIFGRGWFRLIIGSAGRATARVPSRIIEGMDHSTYGTRRRTTAAVRR